MKRFSLNYERSPDGEQDADDGGLPLSEPPPRRMSMNEYADWVSSMAPLYRRLEAVQRQREALVCDVRFRL